jgi:hypothetical protein
MHIQNLIDCISIDEDMVLEYIRNNYNPEEVFDEATIMNWMERSGILYEWAARNGFTRNN